MKPFRTTRTLPFGNGTRKAGFEFGTVKDPQKAIELAGQFEPEFSKLGCELAEGVTEKEAVIALQNHRFLSFEDFPAEIESDPGGDDADSGDDSGDDSGSDDPIDWRLIEIKAEDLIPIPARKTLAGLNIITLGDLNDFGMKNEGFESIDGFGPKTDEDLQEILRGHAEIESDPGDGDE